MPIYEYRCSDCGHELEALQKLSEPALTTCPGCHHEALVKLVSAAGFQLKGSGWYATDFKGGGKSAPAKGDAPAAGKSDAGTGDAAGGSAAKTDGPKSDAPAAAKPASGCGSGCSCH